MGLRDVTHQEKGFFFSVITICEAGTLYSYDAHLWCLRKDQFFFQTLQIKADFKILLRTDNLNLKMHWKLGSNNDV